jgi:tetratricopeptide (TPR) repeat protein
MNRIWLVLLLALACSPQATWPENVIEAHRRADQLIDQGAPATARQVLENVLASLPPGAADTRRVIVQDTEFRLARISLLEHAPAEAARHAEAGLALGGPPTLFVANLLVVRGSAQEALGNRAGAIEDYQRALHINETLLQQATGP